jgi:hypothetical protein
LYCTTSFNSNKEGTNEKSSIASEEDDAFLFASKGRRRPRSRTDLVGHLSWRGFSLPCRRPINSQPQALSHHLLLLLLLQRAISAAVLQIQTLRGQ